MRAAAGGKMQGGAAPGEQADGSARDTKAAGSRGVIWGSGTAVDLFHKEILQYCKNNSVEFNEEQDLSFGDEPIEQMAKLLVFHFYLC